MHCLTTKRSIGFNVILVIAGCLISFSNFAEASVGNQEQQGIIGSSSEPAQPDSQKASEEEKLSVTHHSVIINGKVFQYTATAGCLPITMKTKTGEHAAHMFFVAYTMDQEEDEFERPITFAFNGGPGASSVWLHFGALGPKRVPMSQRDKLLSPPYKLADNEYSLLDMTDLVFIDPVGTGYSRVSEKQDPKEFYGVEGDIQSVGEFIRLYVTRYNRWLSPKFIAGESYGTVRGVLLASYLHDTYGMDINGLVLVSAVLNFQTFSFGPGNDLPFIMFIPTFAATASYHKKLPPHSEGDLQMFLKEVERWALNEYIVALARGDTLPDSETNKIVDKLSRYTGLPHNYIKNKRFRVTRSDFRSELLRAENRTVGILDSRFTILAPSDKDFFDDPDIVATIGPYVAALTHYLRNDLKYENDLPYVFLSQEANQSWNWGSASQGYPSVMDTLREIMSKLRYLKVFIASGYYDLDAPYFATIYNVNHLGLDPSLQSNITLQFYEAGHQMYTDLPSLKKLKADVSAFIKGSYFNSQ